MKVTQQLRYSLIILCTVGSILGLSLESNARDTRLVHNEQTDTKSKDNDEVRRVVVAQQKVILALAQKEEALDLEREVVRERIVSKNTKSQDQKKKYIQKNYKVSSSTKLDVNNKFGRVEVNNWDKSEFDIKVEIIGKGRNEERAQRILDEIEIDISESSGEISFQTDISSSKSKNEEGFEINYTIYMPAKNDLELKNSFGDVSMGDRSGNLDLNVAYGSFKTGNVDGFTNLKLSFGSGSMNDIQDGELTIKYSKFELENAKNLELTQGFSDLELGEVNELDLESKYGGVEIEKANVIDAEAHFSGFEIEELTGSIELKCSYLGNFQIERLAKTFTLVDIDGKFGSYEIGLEPGLNANINADFSFADLKVYSDVDVDFNYRVKESNRSTYKGKIGAGDENKMIRIDSSYGNLRLKED